MHISNGSGCQGDNHHRPCRWSMEGDSDQGTLCVIVVHPGGCSGTTSQHHQTPHSTALMLMHRPQKKPMEEWKRKMKHVNTSKTTRTVTLVVTQELEGTSTSNKMKGDWHDVGSSSSLSMTPTAIAQSQYLSICPPSCDPLNALYVTRSEVEVNPVTYCWKGSILADQTTLAYYCGQQDLGRKSRTVAWDKSGPCLPALPSTSPTKLPSSSLSAQPTQSPSTYEPIFVPISTSIPTQQNKLFKKNEGICCCTSGYWRVGIHWGSLSWGVQNEVSKRRHFFWLRVSLLWWR